MGLLGRLVIAWVTVALFLVFGYSWLADLGSILRVAGLFIWLFAVILWCALGVVEQAGHLAELLGEPLGTLVLTLSIVIIEVVLIAAVAFGSETAPTLGRDTMFAVLMIVLNGVVGLALLLGGLRHHEQAYNLQGAIAYLAVIYSSVGDCADPTELHAGRAGRQPNDHTSGLLFRVYGSALWDLPGAPDWAPRPARLTGCGGSHGSALMQCVSAQPDR